MSARALVVLALCIACGCSRSCRNDRGAGASAEPDAASRLELGPPGSGEGSVTDPYCGMRLRPSEAAATYEHRGTTYSFCLRDHMEAFARDPDRYLGSADAGAAAQPDRSSGPVDADGLAPSSPDADPAAARPADAP